MSLTGGEIFMRKDIMGVLDLFQEKGYACGYLTTNGTIITEERAEALADARHRRDSCKHISVSIDGPGELHDNARAAQEGTFERTRRRAAAAAGSRAPKRNAPLRVSINTTVAPRASRRSTRWWRSPRSWAWTRSA